ncbi:GNAT family N-acetyltransferase [Primorskyibacter sp. S187A]|uniref:GNAT family N-acetyltransferase n=1 Tax=Primorskyibacter sp. S187A TaxID=3415130 RepID=UPI003C7CD1E4
MSAALTLARPEHLERLVAMSGAFAEEMELPSDPDQRGAALLPLLEGSPHGAAYLIGPARAPVGYLVVSFGWSLEFGGLDGFIDEIYIRPAVRGRGMATEVLIALPKALAGAGLRALHLEVDKTDTKTQRLYAKVGFALRDRYQLMTRAL